MASCLASATVRGRRGLGSGPAWVRACGFRLGHDWVERLGLGRRWLGFRLRLGFGFRLRGFRFGRGSRLAVDDPRHFVLRPLDLGLGGFLFRLLVSGAGVLGGIKFRILRGVLAGHARWHLEEDHRLLPLALLHLKCLEVDEFRDDGGHHFFHHGKGAQQDAQRDDGVDQQRQQ